MTDAASPPAIAPRFLARVQALLAQPGRRILGLVGPPGSGKSTLAQALHQAFADVAVVVPMDGYHLANVQLARLGRAHRKGAPDTFDAAGYAALLQRLRTPRPGEVVYAPEFRREIEEPIAGAIAVQPEVRLVITEGNYLLLDQGPWAGVAALLDDCWYVDVDPALRLQRLLTRHVQFGRSPEAAHEWVMRSDEANARVIEATRGAAPVLFRWA